MQIAVDCAIAGQYAALEEQAASGTEDPIVQHGLTCCLGISAQHVDPGTGTIDPQRANVLEMVPLSVTSAAFVVMLPPLRFPDHPDRAGGWLDPAHIAARAQRHPRRDGPLSER